MVSRDPYLQEIDRIAAAADIRAALDHSPLIDPPRFADEVSGRMIGTFDDDWFGATAPDAHIEERRRLADLQRDHPELTGRGLNAFWHYQEAVYALALDLYRAGVRHGAAYEHLRRTVVGEVTTCPGCHGNGVDCELQHCEHCGGSGTVAWRQ